MTLFWKHPVFESHDDSVYQVEDMTRGTVGTVKPERGETRPRQCGVEASEGTFIPFRDILPLRGMKKGLRDIERFRPLDDL